MNAGVLNGFFVSAFAQNGLVGMTGIKSRYVVAVGGVILVLLFPTWVETIFESGISAAAVTAVALNVLFNVWGRHDEAAPVFAEGPAIGDTSAPVRSQH